MTRAELVYAYVSALGQAQHDRADHLEEILTGAGEGLEHTQALRVLDHGTGLHALTLVRVLTRGGEPEQRTIDALPEPVVVAVRGLLGVAS